MSVVEIVKVYREHLPSLRLIGKRYADGDRCPDGGFGGKWEEWFRRDMFAPLHAIGLLPENGDAYVGFMRCATGFEYWIGAFLPAATPVPDGYASLDLPASDIGTCWLHGRQDTGELYGMEPHAMCMAKIREAGWQPAEKAWSFERYNCPRFTTPDLDGMVILDYCIAITNETGE